MSRTLIQFIFYILYRFFKKKSLLKKEKKNNYKKNPAKKKSYFLKFFQLSVISERCRKKKLQNYNNF